MIIYLHLLTITRLTFFLGGAACSEITGAVFSVIVMLTGIKRNQPMPFLKTR